MNGSIKRRGSKKEVVKFYSVLHLLACYNLQLVGGPTKNDKNNLIQTFPFKYFCSCGYFLPFYPGLLAVDGIVYTKFELND